MGRPTRNTDPNIVHLMSCRTVGAQLLMVPDEEVVDIVGGVIAKYQKKHGIVIFALVVLSNHYHLLSNAPKSNLHKFAEEVNREIARRINRYIGRKSFFWGRRYDDIPVIEEKDALEGLLYIATNPTKHGLVKYSKSWPGLNTYFELTTGREKSYKFTNWTSYSAAKRRAERTGEHVFKRDHQTEHLLKLSPIPYFRTKTMKEQAKKLKPLIEERNSELIEERETAGLGFLGRKAIQKQSRKAQPNEVSTSPRPRCYTKSPEARKRFQEEERRRVSAYKEASYLFRSGDLDVEFPPYCLRPPPDLAPAKLQFEAIS